MSKKVKDRQVKPVEGQYDDIQRKVFESAHDRIQRLEKTASDRMSVRVVIEFTGKIRRGDLDRFAQMITKTASLEFEDGGNGG
ncbi:MAG TPA: hypothetical protein VLT62_08920 [Candidatus Methylomirabilis sp.]|nr:hypothetical protein [Candidatus Methylomirabilis sp.]